MDKHSKLETDLTSLIGKLRSGQREIKKCMRKVQDLETTTNNQQKKRNFQFEEDFVDQSFRTEDSFLRRSNKSNNNRPTRRAPPGNGSTILQSSILMNNSKNDGECIRRSETLTSTPKQQQSRSRLSNNNDKLKPTVNFQMCGPESAPREPEQVSVIDTELGGTCDGSFLGSSEKKSRVYSCFSLPPDETVPNVLLNEVGNNRITAKKTPMFTTSLHNGEQDKVPSPRTTNSTTRDGATISEMTSFDVSSADRSQGNVQPLLGYDWIAGLLDNDVSIEDKTDAYFEEIRRFRRKNKDDCVNSTTVVEPSMKLNQDTPGLADGNCGVEEEGHKCVHNYRLNERLFPVPIHGSRGGESECAICREKRNEHTERISSPGYVRISIPRETLSRAYKFKPRRRNSFESFDSLSLSRNCVAGWECSRPSVVPPATSVDLKASIGQGTLNTSTIPKDVSMLANAFPSTKLQNTKELLDRSHSLRYGMQLIEQQDPSTRLAPHSTKYPVF